MAEPPERGPCLVDPGQRVLAQEKLAQAQAWLERFGMLWAAAKREPGDAVFVSRAGSSSRLVIEQYDGGRDARYFFISRKPPSPRIRGLVDLASPLPLTETIGYLPQVAGTAIIYDVTAEALQGKARPFDVSLADSQVKVFALLPVQIEAISLAVDAKADGRVLRVEFRDARGERVQAALPFHLQVKAADGSPVQAGYLATDRDGRFASQPQLLGKAAAGCRIVVHSQLTGREETVKLGQ